ncbi:MAG TPA: hypothetical protein VNB22_01385 [Pyrinomonadaceae bacterium]|nr:hypothetical protein [Pyrinomonadaceae bacterium]
MKKIIASFLMTVMLALSLPLLADAQTRRCYCPTRRTTSRSYRTRSYRNRTAVNRSYRTAGYTYKKPSFYRRHRNMINMGIATGGGALLGGLIGGRRGAGLGALIGLGSGALYTYKLNKKKRRY